MSALREVQHRFAAALSASSGEDDALPLLAGDEARNRALLSIYRATSVASVTAALQLAFPVCARLTGGDYFDALARRFRDAEPSRNGDLNRYGSGFARFLDGFEPVRALPWLPDVARLEWAVHEASIAADAVPAGRELFAGLDGDRLASARLRFMPGFALLGSAHAVADIWLAHQEGGPDLADIDPALAQHAAVWREGWKVRVASVDAAGARFWRGLSGGATVGEAWGEATACAPGFDLAAAFSGAIDDGWLLGIKGD